MNRLLIWVWVCLLIPLPEIEAADHVPARPGMIVINEVASVGIYEFIELKQTAEATVILDESWYIIDSREGWRDGDSAIAIPKGTVLQPGVFITVAPYKIANLSDTPPKNLPDWVIPVKCFALGSVDSVSLVYNNKVVDNVSWNTSVNSLGRDPYNPKEFSSDLVPTPGEENKKNSYYLQSKFSIVINEVCSKGIDYIELYNPSDIAFSFSLDGWTIHDMGRNDSFIIPSDTVIPAKSFLTIYPDFLRLPLSAPRNSLASTEGSRFGLSERDSVFLLYRGEIVDKASWYKHASSAGRYTDGADTWVEEMIITPGKPNRIR
ncbi:MAG: lamin tail domain-containing protein [Spirochaetales bacterium]|jgi:hypothetical protein|nr:lamin tail domain-containing protein [Spirochaetales bacterium]